MKIKKPKYSSLKPLIIPSQSGYQADWPQTFQRQAPLIVEIGFGLGEFLIRQGESHPEQQFVGIEHHWFPTWRTLRRLNASSAGNIRLIFSDAYAAFLNMFKPRSLAGVYALFPDPWFKKRHFKNRLFSRRFLRLVAHRLKKGKELRIVTDNRNYFQWIKEESADTGFIRRCEDIDSRYDTKYERKWKEGGQRHFFQITLTKKDHPSVVEIKEKEMKTYRVADFSAENFHVHNVSGPVAIAFKDFIFDRASEKAMLHAIVSEEGLTQQFWISLSRVSKGWCIRLASGCNAVPTQGVNQALDVVYQAAVRSCR